jgi:hypothetical protein
MPGASIADIFDRFLIDGIGGFMVERLAMAGGEGRADPLRRARMASRRSGGMGFMGLG